jgi:Photoprotection regulator fluorescence recovery protein
MHDLKWSNGEKKAAKSLFETALQRELHAYIEEFKERAAKVEKPDDLWLLSKQATMKQREIDEKYDFRYSQLIFVFANLLRNGTIQENELAALGEEKARYIVGIANL